MAVFYAMLTNEYVWAGHLSAPPKKEGAAGGGGGTGGATAADAKGGEGEGDDEGVGEGVGAGGGEGGGGGEGEGGGEGGGEPQFGPMLVESGRPFGAQLRSAAFIAVGVWSLFTIYRTMLLLVGAARRSVRVYAALVDPELTPS